MSDGNGKIYAATCNNNGMNDFDENDISTVFKRTEIIHFTHCRSPEWQFFIKFKRETVLSSNFPFTSLHISDLTLRYSFSIEAVL